jgi:hypothetical protein
LEIKMTNNKNNIYKIVLWGSFFLGNFPSVTVSIHAAVPRPRSMKSVETNFERLKRAMSPEKIQASDELCSLLMNAIKDDGPIPYETISLLRRGADEEYVKNFFILFGFDPDVVLRKMPSLLLDKSYRRSILQKNTAEEVAREIARKVEEYYINDEEIEDIQAMLECEFPGYEKIINFEIDKIMYGFILPDEFDFGEIDSEGASPLFVAIKRRNIAAIEAILRSPEAATLVNTPNRFGVMPLHLAALLFKYTGAGKKSIMQMLIESGFCNLNAQIPSSGNTALHLAVLTRSEAALELLQKSGASADIENNEGLVPARLSVILMENKNIIPDEIER